MKGVGPWVVGGLGVFAAATLLLIATGNTEVPVGTETEEGSNASLLGLALVTAFGLLLVRGVPPRLHLRDRVFEELEEKGRVRVRREVLPGLGISVLLSAAAFVIPTLTGLVVGDVWVLLKLVLFLVVPALLLWRYGGSLGLFSGSDDGWVRFWFWFGPLVVSAAYLGATMFGPFAQEYSVAPELLEPSVLPYVLAASLVVNFVTAGLAEELFFRAYLQSRLEYLIGRWGGILIPALLFALMHLPLRLTLWMGQSGSFFLDALLALAAVVVLNGTFGVFAGYLWLRYRNFVVLVLMHTGLNVIPFYLLASGVL